MGFIDDVSDAFNRGTASVQRTGRSAQLKIQLNDLAKQRRDLAGQLGSSLYDVVKDNPDLRRGREPLFEAIERVDMQRASIEAEIAQIEAEAAMAHQAPDAGLKCPTCGTDLHDTDVFCSGCGASVAEIKAAKAAEQAAQTTHQAPASGLKCPTCGSSLKETDVFCSGCGASVAEIKAAKAAEQAAAQPDEPAEGTTPAGGKLCMSCGSPLEESDSFCMSCGAKVASAGDSGETTAKPQEDPSTT